MVICSTFAFQPFSNIFLLSLKKKKENVKLKACMLGQYFQFIAMIPLKIMSIKHLSNGQLSFGGDLAQIIILPSWYKLLNFSLKEKMRLSTSYLWSTIICLKDLSLFLKSLSLNKYSFLNIISIQLVTVRLTQWQIISRFDNEYSIITFGLNQI